ncbi:MAG: acetyl-CoA carboxylase, carboxyltransferase subunit beta [Hyphomicrobiaceae bacterium]|nr:acetyl-CoA carboxylase, carboxyltransferase subunit beta [Hyphomicrobiaceae bacterium]
MNWINNVVPPKIRSLLTTRREPPDDFWRKCGGCGQMTDRKALEQNQFVFPCCGHHDRVDARSRLKQLFDGGEYTLVPTPEVPLDPLKFRDGKRYTDRLKEAKVRTEQGDAVLIGEGRLEGQSLVAAVQDFRFMGGSLGMAAGEAVVTAMELAVERHAPFILFAASGGARMQEGILSLMQMPRTTIAVRRLRAARLPYVVVLTDPTTGGVTASYAMLGDIHIAEPGALICFAGPRVIEQTIREQLPEGFQRAEYLLAHGMIDMVVHRHKLRETLARIVTILGAGHAAMSARKRSRANGRGKLNGHLNGSALDGKAMEALAREGNGLIEPEPVAEGDRFQPRMLEGRTPPRTESDKSRPKTGKDGGKAQG